MYEFLLMTKYVLFQSIGFFILAIAVVALLFIILYIISKKFNMARKIALPAIVLVLGIFLLFFSPQLLDLQRPSARAFHSSASRRQNQSYFEKSSVQLASSQHRLTRR